MKRIVLCAALSLAASVRGGVQTPKIEDVRLGGDIGRRMDLCVERCVKASDVAKMTSIFFDRTETIRWQSEFWGKWMHSAVPYVRLTGDAALRQKIEESFRQIRAAQLPNGYIGNYTEARQLARSTWDVWGRKYTLLGLILYHDLTGDATALDCAARLVDHLMGQLKEDGKSLVKAGCHRGLASCSILEPLVLLFNRTKDERYRRAAELVVSEMCENPEGPELVKRASMDVAKRFPDASALKGGGPSKAYEMMSCYQGLYEWYRVTGKREFLDAVLKTAYNIVEKEITVLGGGSSMECWMRGKQHETEPWRGPNETCVTTTWMRFCSTLLAETGDLTFADELEKSLYNIYLGSMRRDCATWTQYCPADGCRGEGSIQCGMGTSCCIQNGPRGFLAVMKSLIAGRSDGVDVNLFVESTATVPAVGGRVTIAQRTAYPKDGDVNLTVSCDPAAEGKEWTLRLRVPGWCNADGKPSWKEVRRVWRSGDTCCHRIDMKDRFVEKNGFMAVFHGPVALARSSAFKDGDVNEILSCPFDESCPLALKPIEIDDVQCAFEVKLPFGNYTGDKNPRGYRFVRMCDWASAANRWPNGDTARLWIPYTRLMPVDDATPSD